MPGPELLCIPSAIDHLPNRESRYAVWAGMGNLAFLGILLW